MSAHAYTEDTLVEQPAIGLFASLGWQVAGPPPNAGVDGVPVDAGLLGRETSGEVVLIPRLRAALERLNPTLPPEAVSAAVEELTRDRSAMSLVAAKREGVKVLKVIHGYGSSGKGGALCIGLRKSFGLRKKEGVIKDFIAGEDFSIFNDTVLTLLEAVPELRGDPDLGATNEGITIVWLK